MSAKDATDGMGSQEQGADGRAISIDAVDRSIIVETQTGLPVEAAPYHAIARKLGLNVTLVMARMQAMLDSGVIRRIGAIPNHYRLGYKANGMVVWDVLEDRLLMHGERVGQLDFVSHCYQRPRHMPVWPYNFFVMVHGADRSEVEEKVLKIAHLLGDDCRGYEILYSTRILKKTGLRIS